MRSACDVYCIGNVVADIVVGPVMGLPPPGGIQMLDRVALVAGGNAVNTTVALARLGKRVRVAGAVGNDRFGLLMREALRQNGVDDTNLVRIEDAVTGVTVALVESSGERRFLHMLGANGTFSGHHLNWELAEGSHFFHCASTFVLPAFDGEPLAEAMGRAKHAGMHTSLDVCWDALNRGLSILEKTLKHTDLMFLNQDEGRQLTGVDHPAGIASHLLGMGIETVVVKVGAAGCYAACRNRAFHCPGFPVQPVDTTGAGDCFAAAFLAALCDGSSLEQAARFANAAAALSTLALGGSDAAPTRGQVVDFLERHAPATPTELPNL